MRDIKFRAWNKVSKKMYPVWELWFGNNNVHPNGPNGALLDIGNDKTVFCEFDVIELMQFTGLKDKNGTEVDWWEDDLLQSLGVDKRIGQIKYDERYAEWRLYVDGNSWCSLAAAYYDGWRYIGNIHQKPELIEGKKDE